jgi:hypothetical protein
MSNFAGGDIVFDWNGVDVSQFESTAAFSTAGWSHTLTRVTDFEAQLGGILRLEAMGPAGDGALVVLANDALPTPSQVRRYTFEYEVVGITERYAGICFLADDSGAGLHGYMVSDGVGGWRGRIDNGSLTIDAGTGGATVNLSERAFVRYTIMGDKRSDGPPRYNLYGSSNQETGIEDRVYNHQDPPWADEPASWDSLDCNRWGLCIQSDSGFTPGKIEIASIRVRVFE